LYLKTLRKQWQAGQKEGGGEGDKKHGGGGDKKHGGDGDKKAWRGGKKSKEAGGSGKQMRRGGVNQGWGKLFGGEGWAEYILSYYYQGFGLEEMGRTIGH
jgi:hypothetical protein